MIQICGLRGGDQANFLGNINFEIGVVLQGPTWVNILGGFWDLGAIWAPPMPVYIWALKLGI